MGPRRTRERWRFRVWVSESGGREPPKQVPFPRFSCVEQMTGLEPAASTLGGWRSAW